MGSRKYEQQPILQPKVVVIPRKSNQGFGFTLRHFIAYPPDDTPRGSNQKQAMETVFIKEVHPNGPAYVAGLKQGDRLLTVNNLPVAGLPYSTIVGLIKQTPSILTLNVVPKECDVLQMYYTDIAHNPESNQRSKPFSNDLTQNLRSRPHQVVHNPYPPFPNLHNDFAGATASGNLKFEHDEAISLYDTSYQPSSNQQLMRERLRKSIEQKEEFLRSPPPFNTTSNLHSRREFFSQSNDNYSPVCDIRKAVISAEVGNFISQSQSTTHKREILSHINNHVPPPYQPPPTNLKAPPAKLPIKDNQSHQRQFMNLSTVQTSKSNEYVNKFWRHPNENNLTRFNCDRIKENSNATNEVIEKRHSDDFNVVSQLTKRFETGSPLSPDSRTIDKTLLYKSELSRINKFSNPIVNIRKKEIEMKTRFLGKDDLVIPNFRNETQVLQTPNISKDVEIKDDLEQFERCDDYKALSASSHVVRRCKPAVVDDNKIARRISYLRATGNESEYHSDVPSCPEATAYEEQINEKDEDLRKSNIIPMIIADKVDKSQHTSLESDMSIKTSGSADKISHCRSWHACKIQLVGNVLKAHTKQDTNLLELDVRDFNVTEDELSKRKCVFKLTSKTIKNQSDKHTSPMEILFQTRNSSELKKWLATLYGISFNGISNEVPTSKAGSQLAEPQKVSAITSVQTNIYCEESVHHTYEAETSVTTENGFHQTTTTTTKSRKSSQQKEYSEKEMGSPKSRTWKHLFRKIQGNSGDTSSSYSPPPIIGSIGVPLRMCPMSKDNEHVPYLVDLCIKIVETKGLNVKGIYRIPGNKAAISELRDQVNKKDFDFENSINDPKWDDVNVVSSLLKLFIRSLPDALLPSSFYNNFIEADKKIGERRCKELLSLLQSLPIVSYETLKYIIRHLHRVSKKCDVNLMEPKNLAIIFGPSIIRTPDETLEIAVKDMKYQCRIVELFVTQYEYFFESGALPELVENPMTPVAATSQQDQTSLLLDNVSKIEQKFHDKESVGSRFIPHLRRRTHKKSSTNSDTYSGESISSFESKPVVEEKLKDSCDSRHNDELDSIDGGSTEQTEDELNISRISDTGSMSLTTVTDVLETKLRDIRKTPDIPDQKENLSTKSIVTHKRNQTKPLTMGENIPYADESPERNYTFDGNGSFKITGRTLYVKSPLTNYNYDTKTSTTTPSSRTSLSYTHDLQSDDSEVSTTSDPKDQLVISPLILERYKKRRDYRLFRSASFNCRNYSSRAAQTPHSVLTKDEKTDMNITKKRQIQNKQNRSIKRRHTLGSPNDYFTTITRQTNNDNMIEVGIRIKNVKKRS